MQKWWIQSEGCGTKTSLYSSHKRLLNRCKYIASKGGEEGGHKTSPVDLIFCLVEGLVVFWLINTFQDARQQLIDTKLRNAQLCTENLQLEKQVWDVKLSYWKEKHRFLHSSTMVWCHCDYALLPLDSCASIHICLWIRVHTSTCGIPDVEVVWPVVLNGHRDVYWVAMKFYPTLHTVDNRGDPTSDENCF